MTEEQTPTAEQVQAQREKFAQMLKDANNKRNHGFSMLADKLESFDAALEALKGIDPQSRLQVVSNKATGATFSLENELRNVLGSMVGALQCMEGINQLVDFVCSDLGGVVNNLQDTRNSLVLMSAQVKMLTELLLEKGVLTEEEMNQKLTQVLTDLETRNQPVA